jgi:circadian clock protein KaiB
MKDTGRKFKTDRTAGAFARALATQPTPKNILRLYVAGASERSRQAVVRARQLCQAEFDRDFELEVIDVYQQPILARHGQIVATPTLVREFPPPACRHIGDLSNTIRLSVGLDLPTQRKNTL